MKIFICVIALTTVMVAGDAFADAEAGQGYFSVMGSFIDDDKDRGVDDTFGGQFSIGKALNENWNFEVLYQNSRAGSGSGTFKYTGFGLDFQRVFMRSSGFSPYIHAGVGSFQSEPPGADGDTGGMLSAGLGFYLDIFKSNASLRGEWRYREDKALGNNLADNIISLGIQLPFGSTSAPIVVAAAVDPDSDGDGVYDSSDQCPNTPTSVSVDSRGCPLDIDRDGVSDDRDQCPGTVAGAAVDANGCELDSDGDGVVDRLDECPGTAAGVQVDIRGCEIKAEISLRGVNFESSSDRLASGAESVLADAVATLQKNPTIEVEVAGHTDSIGAAATNESLSARRAQTVHDYLASHGIAVDRMTVRGYGESEPIADNETSAGRAENRRVVLRLTDR